MQYRIVLEDGWPLKEVIHAVGPTYQQAYKNFLKKASEVDRSLSAARNVHEEED